MLLFANFQNDIKDSWSPSKIVPNRHPQRRIKRPHLAKKPSTRPSTNKISEASSEDVNQTTRRSVAKIKKNRRRKISTSTTTTTPEILEPYEEATKNHRPYLIDFIEDVEAVVGLVPPSSYQYRTIVSPEEDFDSRGSNRISQQVIIQNVIHNHSFILSQHSRCMIIVPLYPKL